MAWQISSVSTRYGRHTFTGFSGTWQCKVTNPKILGRVIARELADAVEHGEGLEIEVQR